MWKPNSSVIVTQEVRAQRAAEDIGGIDRLIDAERDRRISAGIEFDGVRYQTRPGDIDNVGDACTAAIAALVAGYPHEDAFWHGGDAPFEWFAEDNTAVPMSAKKLMEFGRAVFAHKAALVAKGRALKDGGASAAFVLSDEAWI